MPYRYCRDAVGRWRCPPGERFAAQFGLLYRLRSSSEIDWVLQRNLRFLNDYLIKAPSVDNDTSESVLTLINQRPGVQLDALLDRLGEARADDISPPIVSGRIHVELHAVALAEPQHVRLFSDQETASACGMDGRARTKARTPPGFLHAVRRDRRGDRQVHDGGAADRPRSGEPQHRAYLPAPVGNVG